MFQIKKRILIIIQLLALVSAYWNSLPQVRTGSFQPLTTLTSDTSATLNYAVPFVGNLSVPGPSATLSWGLGLVGYENYLTISFSYNVTVTTLNSTVLTVTVKPEDGSYLVSLRLCYIVTSFLIPSPPGLEVIRGCFKCLNISQDVNITTQGLGYRSESFTQSSNFTNSSAIETRAFLYSFNFSNIYGQTNYLKVSSVLVNSAYSHTVTTMEYNKVNYVCLSVVSWDSNCNHFGNGIAGTFKDYPLNTVNMTQYVYYYSEFDTENIKFMGFSTISHSMGGKRILGVHPEQYNNFRLSSYFDSNNYTLEASLTIFYFGSLICNGATPLYVPSDMSCASSCPGIYYVNQSNQCVACSSNCFVCDVNDPNNCTQCISTTHRSNDTCICTNGYFSNSTDRSTNCMVCSDYMKYCTLCENATVCLNCTSDKYLVNGTCQCLNNTNQTYLVNGICLTYPGCINATWVTNAVYCGACNTSANFRHPNATNLTCVCLPGYNNNATRTFCLPDCGDGKIVNQACDDGNKNDTDGCNSTCQIVPGWYCFVNSTTNASSCLQIQTQSGITYHYAQRIIGTNTALLFFTFQPAGINMDANAFSNAISTDAPITTITPTYNAANSSITLLVAFKENLQGNTYNFTFAFTNAQVYYTDPISSQALLQGINEQLKYQTYGIMVKTMQYTLMGTAFVGLGLGMVCAAVGYKLMGLELLLPMQAAFFAEFSMANPPPYVSTLKNMKYTLGYNQLLPYDYSKYVGSNSKFAKFDFQIEMALNINVMASILVFATIILLILQIIYLYRYSEAAQQQQKNAPPPPPQVKKNGKGKKEQKVVFEVKEQGVMGLQLKEARQSRNSFVNNFYFYLSASLAQQILFCFIIQNSQYQVNDFYLSEDINVMSGYFTLLLMIGNLVFMVLQWGEKKDRRVITFHETRVIKYPIYLIVSCLMMPLVVAITMNYSYSAHIASAMGVLPLIGLIYFRPYRHEDTKLNAFSAFINLAFPMVASATYLVNNIMELPQLGWVISVGIVIIWQFATEATTIIRMVKTIPWRELPLFQKCVKKKTKRNDDGLLEKHKVDVEMTSMVKNSLKGDGGQIIDWEQKNRKEYESISQKPDNDDPDMSQHNEEEDELAQLKKRLKKEINMKKAY